MESSRPPQRPSFRTIPQLLTARYGSGVGSTMDWSHLASWLRDHFILPGIDLNPIFQRGRVWTTQQKIRYVEFRLAGGTTGGDIHFNDPSPSREKRLPLLLMDGKQRIDAALSFLDGELPVFGHVLSEYVDQPDRLSFQLHIHRFTEVDEILQWYCDMNRGGVVHSDAEIARVQGLVGKCDRLTSTPDQRFEEMNVHASTQLSIPEKYYGGVHICGIGGMREENLDTQFLRRWATCEACDNEYRRLYPSTPTPAPEPTPAKKPRRRGPRR